jgi:hypothetical protein
VIVGAIVFVCGRCLEPIGRSAHTVSYKTGETDRARNRNHIYERQLHGKTTRQCYVYVNENQSMEMNFVAPVFGGKTNNRTDFIQSVGTMQV